MSENRSNIDQDPLKIRSMLDEPSTDGGQSRRRRHKEPSPSGVEPDKKGEQPSPSGVQQNQSGNPREALEVFVENLDARGYHPVIIMGGAGAGKTVLIASLLYHLNRSDGRRTAMTSFDQEPLFSGADGVARHDEARAIYQRTLAEFSLGRMPERTSFAKPFFIPITIQPMPETGGEPVKFAIMESRGEFYDLNQGTAKSYYKTTVDEIKILYEKFKKPIRIIFVAAGHHDGIAECETDVQRKEREDRDAAMYAMLQNYRQERGEEFKKATGKLDPCIFVLTKWDMHFSRNQTLVIAENGARLNPAFLTPTRAELEPVIRKRYPRAWAEFCVNRSADGDDDHMAYSAGIIAGAAEVRKLKVPDGIWPDEARVEIEDGLEHRSAAKLVDWLYKSVTGYELSEGPPKPPENSFIRILRKLLG